MTKPNSIEELSNAMEKMYQEHSAEIVSLSQMITSLAKVAGVDPVVFAKQYQNQDSIRDYANTFNKALDDAENK